MPSWLSDLVGTDMAPLAYYALVAAIVLALIVIVLSIAKKAMGAGGGPKVKGRGPRLAVMDVSVIDPKRKLVLVRRDEVEHLLLIGGQNDLVVEAGILRVPAAARQARTDPTLGLDAEAGSARSSSPVRQPAPNVASRGASPLTRPVPRPAPPQAPAVAPPAPIAAVPPVVSPESEPERVEPALEAPRAVPSVVVAPVVAPSADASRIPAPVRDEPSVSRQPVATEPAPVQPVPAVEPPSEAEATQPKAVAPVVAPPVSSSPTASAPAVPSPAAPAVPSAVSAPVVPSPAAAVQPGTRAQVESIKVPAPMPPAVAAQRAAPPASAPSATVPSAPSASPALPPVPRASQIPASALPRPIPREADRPQPSAATDAESEPKTIPAPSLSRFSVGGSLEPVQRSGPPSAIQPSQPQPFQPRSMATPTLPVRTAPAVAELDAKADKAEPDRTDRGSGEQGPARPVGPEPSPEEVLARLLAKAKEPVHATPASDQRPSAASERASSAVLPPPQPVTPQQQIGETLAPAVAAPDMGERRPLSVRSFASAIQGRQASTDAPNPPTRREPDAQVSAAPTVSAAAVRDAAPGAPTRQPATAWEDEENDLEDFLSAQLNDQLGEDIWTTKDAAAEDAVPAVEPERPRPPSRADEEPATGKPAPGKRPLTLEEEMERLLGDFDLETSDRRGR